MRITLTLSMATFLLTVVAGDPAAAAVPIQPVQSQIAWIDANGDGRSDYCRLISQDFARQPSCVLSNGSGFGTTWTKWQRAIPGDTYGRAWADQNGDGRAEFCSIFNGWNGKYARCDGYDMGPIDGGYDDGSRAWVDFNGDGRADYCRLVGWPGKYPSCSVSNANPTFGLTFTHNRTIDAGYDAGRAWVDVNGDGKADYCRIVADWGTKARCTLSTGTGFQDNEVQRSISDAGFDATRKWADINGDRRADFCRVIGWYQFTCTSIISSGSFLSEPTNPGADSGQAWADHNLDSRADACRVINNDRITCTLTSGGTVPEHFTDPGWEPSRGWADFTGDGRADYCRAVGDGLVCSPSNGGGFNADIKSPAGQYIFAGWP